MENRPLAAILILAASAMNLPMRVFDSDLVDATSNDEDTAAPQVECAAIGSPCSDAADAATDAMTAKRAQQNLNMSYTCNIKSSQQLNHKRAHGHVSEPPLPAQLDWTQR